MNTALKTFVLTTVTASLCLTATPPASAWWFARQHPRRAEVDRREHRQQERIGQGIATGSLTPAEGAQLEGQERALRQQERQDVQTNGGYLTKGQQQQLNREEDALSHEIYQEKHT